MNKTARAFTIVELLIVIVVIAILAAISITAYTGIQDRANASAAQTSASQAARRIEAYYAEHDMYPDGLSDAQIDSAGFQYIHNNASNPPSFCLTSTSKNKSYYVSSIASAPAPGSCPGHGANGAPAITNVALNPRGSVAGPGLAPNNSAVHTRTKGVTVPATTDGITTAVESRLANGATSREIMNLYSIDGHPNNSGILRSISCWVRVNAGGYKVTSKSGYWDSPELPADTWVRVQSLNAFPGSSYASLIISKISASDRAQASDRGYITGIMAVEGSQHYSFADGDSPGWAWQGANGMSSSTGPAP